MCGRFNLTATAEQLADHFQGLRVPEFEASYNIAPGQKILAVVGLADKRLKFVKLQWGLIPSWVKDNNIGHHLINARAETLQQKPSFRSAFKHRRCLIPATGYYEWQTWPDHKQAYHVHRQDNRPFAFAGLWEHWQRDDATIYSCTLITTSACPALHDIHERMPVLLAESDYRLWLDQATPPEQLLALMDHFAYPTLTATPVSPWVNNPRHNSPACIK